MVLQMPVQTGVIGKVHEASAAHVLRSERGVPFL